MKVLLVHNYYRQRGGEDLSFEDEVALLQTAGHDVLRYIRHNDEIDGAHGLRLAQRAIWNREAYEEVRGILQRERPVLMHCTNTFPLISPSVYYAAAAERVPVVQALRNYRLLCLNAFLSRNDRVCEQCVGRLPWPGVRHGCYRGSRLASAVAAAQLWYHRRRATYTRLVNVFYTLTEFSRQKFIEGGLPAQKIMVKANCVRQDPGIGPGDRPWAVFVGRLSPEKGVETLLAAWPHVHDLDLHIIGDGPLKSRVNAASGENSRIHYHGPLAPHDTLDLIGRAQMLVMPSTWYETFGRTIIEAYAKGVPVIASRLGAMAELVEDSVTGRLFTPGDPHDLAAVINQVLERPAQLLQMRRRAREIYAARYTAAASYERLLHIYEQALQQSSSGSPGVRPPAATLEWSNEIVPGASA